MSNPRKANSHVLAALMEDKTVIIKPEPPGGKKPAAKKARDAKPAPPSPAPKPKKHSSLPTVFLSFVALALVGFGAALASVYYFSPIAAPNNQVTLQDLNADLVPVETAEDEAGDEALVRAAIAPRIINLSGDPVIVRQLSKAPRQAVKLDAAPQRKAAGDIGVKGDVFRIKDVLDTPDFDLRAGLAGPQEDIATLSDFTPTTSQDPSLGASMVETSEGSADDQQMHEFAQKIPAKARLSDALTGLGADPQLAKDAEAAFSHYYNRTELNPNDKLAVRALAEPNSHGALTPVQVSVYDQQSLVGSIGLDDIDHYVQSADPWAGQDIFEAELLPQDVRPEDRPRLLDAIYAAALRNRLPNAVTGEAITLLSRAQDLEQKTQTGDTITLVYSPTARDAKTGLGRIVYVGIGRTTGNLDCYAFQADANSGFDCVSGAGDSSVPQNGMTLPVNGVIVAKFGAQQPDSTANNMNFGVDWSAPEGSPVVAAYDGKVQSVGSEASLGLTIRLTHNDNKTSMYAYLQRPEPGLTVGTQVKAGQVIGYVGLPQSSRAPRLHFELRENDVPVDPLPEAQPSAGGGEVVDQFVHRIITIESQNLCTAHNPLSTAVGLGQFIESTWMTTVRIHRPDLLVGHSRQEVLNMRLDCNLSRAMTTAFTRDNAAVLRSAGVSVTPGNLYLAHFLGVGGAIKALAGNSGRLISDVFGAAHVRANPFEAGKSVGFLAAWAAKKMSGAAAAPAKAVASTDQPSKPKADAIGGTSAATNSAAPTDAASTPMARYDANPEFTKLKNAVTAFLL